MVIMTVAEDNGINSSQFNTERFGVSDYCICLSGIKQKFVLFSLNIDTQPVFGNAVFSPAGVLNECDYRRKSEHLPERS